MQILEPDQIPGMAFRYFNSAAEAHDFSMKLGVLAADIPCPHCGACGQLCSHGFYRKADSEDPAAEPVDMGKRLICNNRNGWSGCGRTMLLLARDHLDQLQYKAKQVSLFLLLLLKNFSISRAYRQATKASDHRNAYRWLKRIDISKVRQFLDRVDAQQTYTSFSRRPVLLSTIHTLRNHLGDTYLADFQVRTQQSILYS